MGTGLGNGWVVGLWAGKLGAVLGAEGLLVKGCGRGKEGYVLVAVGVGGRKSWPGVGVVIVVAGYGR